MPTLTDYILPHYFVLYFTSFFKIGSTWHVYVIMPPLYRIDLGNEVFYALDENEKESILARKK